MTVTQETIENRKKNDDCGAPCGFCWEMLFAYSPSCQTCRLRPFGSAPCLDDMPEYQECPGSDCCPNGGVCCEVLEHEWPLAELAINFTESTKGSEPRMSDIYNHYLRAHNRVVAAGYQSEINYQQGGVRE